ICGMGRIMAIDYGRKRCGVAVTDPLRIAVHPLETVLRKDLLAFLEKYMSQEEVDELVLGKAFHADGRPMEISEEIDRFAAELRKKFPGLAVNFQDENFSSQRASKLLVEAGLPRQKRREKGRVDRISAVLILQDYLGHI